MLLFSFYFFRIKLARKLLGQSNAAIGNSLFRCLFLSTTKFCHLCPLENRHIIWVAGIARGYSSCTEWNESSLESSIKPYLVRELNSAGFWNRFLICFSIGCLNILNDALIVSFPVVQIQPDTDMCATHARRRMLFIVLSSSAELMASMWIILSVYQRVSVAGRKVSFSNLTHAMSIKQRK